MIKKYGMKALALVIAISAAAFTVPSHKAAPDSNFYYQFTGAHGQENIVGDWMELTLDQYNALNCPSGSAKGCKIVNSTNSSGHPTSVPLSGGVPTATSPNLAVANRN